jgi:hypothetical protein
LLVGELQAAAIDATAPPSVQAEVGSNAARAGFDEPADDPGALDKDLGELNAEEQEGEETAERVEHAAELAVAAIAATIQLTRWAHRTRLHIARFP